MKANEGKIISKKPDSSKGFVILFLKQFLLRPTPTLLSFLPKTSDGPWWEEAVMCPSSNPTPQQAGAESVLYPQSG